ncbi:fe-S cluster assembly factor HCF101, chloroplastic-like [Hibiscus syriacus]|uniref:fe-S cluster assembly factor HCF101, chloroplastic-like n=1 Tax=Hibiscus syriacus TaxID=106335 RepID=UPI0019218213|nr:fe-S cluster assembly factor HCF101, chloroplastic-like [Hibiscus syriacus]
MQLLHAPPCPSLSFPNLNRNSRGLLSLEKCLQPSTANCFFQPQKLERSIWVSDKLSVFSFFAPKATSVDASSAATTGTAEGDVLKALSQIIDPDFGTDIVSSGFLSPH